jgi:hypothetical protein
VDGFDSAFAFKTLCMFLGEKSKKNDKDIAALV